jgi:DNA-binding response OmpR family regulator
MSKEVNMHVLIVEDEPEMAGLLAKGLREELFDVSVARDGQAALDMSLAQRFDLILLDIMLPKVSGMEVAEQLRKREYEAPILMLTARDALPDIVKGLDSGADDYLTKPFSFPELLARMRALVRRNEFHRKNVLQVEDLVLDLISHRTFRKGQEIHLSLTEFRLLELLVRNAESIVSRRDILASVWGNRREVTDNTLDAFMRLLRKKVDRDGDPRLVHTHRGFGYSIGLVKHSCV